MKIKITDKMIRVLKLIDAKYDHGMWTRYGFVTTEQDEKIMKDSIRDLVKTIKDKENDSL